ncbi:MAG TPA: archaellin/type IV pilin N-terminal domain-containing protein [archaeon]|nr:archaellin/type IV pilin N-terminal domain-containing protein [archaeon]
MDEVREIRVRLKGISPLIATVIVLAFTIAVAGIVGVFLTGFTTSQTGSVGTTGTKLTQCASSALDIDWVKIYCGTGIKNANITVSYATGSRSLSNITLLAVSGGNTSRIANQTEMQVGDFYSWYLNITSSNPLLPCPVDSFRVTGLCLNETTIQAQCDKGDACYTQIYS